MNQKLVMGIGGGVALMIFIALVWAIVEYRTEQTLTQNVKGRWEHVTRTKQLTVTDKTWRIDQWDDVTNGWHDVSHGTWTVRDTGTFIFVSELTNATFSVKIDGDKLVFDYGDTDMQPGEKYNRMK